MAHAYTITLVDFLNARLDEDEAVARAALALPDGGSADGVWSTGTRAVDAERVEGVGFTIYDEGGHSAEQATHIARQDPARVLRDVEAKRAIMAIAEDIQESVITENGDWYQSQILDALAAPYADHPDYDEAWRPA